MHISEQVAAELISQGWKRQSDGGFTKMIGGFAPAGSFGNGRRIVRITIDESGRWLARTDGFSNVDRDVDLRDYSNNPKAAILAVLN